VPAGCSGLVAFDCQLAFTAEALNDLGVAGNMVASSFSSEVEEEKSS